MNRKEILLVTNYFPPERGAASNRMHSLAQGLQQNGYSVHVVCPMPNYPKGVVFKEFKGKTYSKTQEEDVVVHRLWLWPSNSSNKFVRLLSMISFSVSLSIFFLFKNIPRKIIIQYSPVFVGFTAVLFSWLFRKKIILNVSDLWPLAGLEMGLLNKGFYYSLLEKMERFCYKKAHLILGQSQEILSHIVVLEPDKRTFLYRNFPNFNAPVILNKEKTEKITLVYAGLLGVAQGLYNICKYVVFSENIQLHIYGAGPEAEKIASLQNDHIIFHGERSREVLHKSLLHYDIAFIPLQNRIYGSVPSKIFEYTRLGLPVLYYAGGEGESIVKGVDLGWTVPVNDSKSLQHFIDTLTTEKFLAYPKTEIQQKAKNHFNFHQQFKELVVVLEKI